MSDEPFPGSGTESRPDLPERVDRSSVADGSSVTDAALATSVVSSARRRGVRRVVPLGVILAGTALATGFLVAGAAAWWRPAEPFPVNDGLSVEELVAAEGDRLPDDPQAEEGRVRAILAEIRADIDADRLEPATYTFESLDRSLAAKPLPALAADCTAVLNELVGGWIRRMMRCSKEGRLDEMLVAHELLTTRRSKMPKPLSTLILDSRQFDDRRDRIIPFRQAWLTFARGCVSRLDREGLRTAVRHLRNDPMFARNHGDVVVRWLWLHFAEESMLRGDRDAANEALQCAKLCGAPPERIAALAEPDGAAIRVASGLQRLRAGAVAAAAVAVFDALAIDRDAAVAALQEIEAAPLLAVALDSCQARFERAVTDEDWAAATEADSLARCLAPGSGSWLTEVLTGTRLQALGAEFVASLPAAAAAALPAASIEALLPVHNSIGMEFALVAGGQVVIDRDEPASPAAIDVTITGPFFVGLAPVTFAQWKRVMGGSGELGEAGPDGVDTAANASPRVPVAFADDAPMHSRTWAEAEDFCRRLTDLPEERAAGRAYRMPSEAEWVSGLTSLTMRATRAATGVPGATPGDQAAASSRSEPGDDELGGAPVTADQPVGSGRQPVWEWVSRRLDAGDVPATGRIIDPRAQEGVGVTQPVLQRRGRSWPPTATGKGAPGTNTAAASRDPSIGFRVVMVMQPTPSCEDTR